MCNSLDVYNLEDMDFDETEDSQVIYEELGRWEVVWIEY